MPKIFLTDDIVFDANCPTDKDQELYWDYAVVVNGQIRNGSVAGLGLRVTGLGHKSFVHAYQFDGKRCRKVLGSTTTMSVASARLAVVERDQKLKAGRIPTWIGSIHAASTSSPCARPSTNIGGSHVSGLSAGYRYNFAIFVAHWLRPAPTVVTRRGYNSKRLYKDFGAMFADRPLTAIKPIHIEEFFSAAVHLSLRL